MSRRGPRGLLLAAVLMAHFGLVVSIVHLTRVAPKATQVPTGRTVTWLRLLNDDRLVPPLPEHGSVRPGKADDSRRRPTPEARSARTAAPTGRAPDLASQDTRAAAGVTPGAITWPEVHSPQVVAEVPHRNASSPLDLRWRNPESPSAAAAAAAAAAGRDRPGRLTLRERLDRDLGGAEPLKQETTAMGHRYRSGGGCVEVRPSRASGLDSFNASVQPIPRQASRC